MVPPDPVTRLNEALAGHYRVERPLGEGGMATVYLAEDLRHGRRVALKVLKPDLGGEVGSERFLREIRIAAGLNHPNVVSLIDSGEADGLLYYVMFYVEGESLRDRLDREKQLSVDEALRIAGHVGDALIHAHARGVVHRDIKPANVLLQGDRVQVADFGIAKAVQEAGGHHLTRTGLAVGTPLYVSPEQGGGGEEVDERADLYSLACVLYEMLAGEAPFGGATPQAILARKTLDRPMGLRVVRPTVPSAVEAAIFKALNPTPADRQASVSEFLAELSAPGEVAEVVGSAAAPRRSLLYIGSGIATVLVLAAVATFTGREGAVLAPVTLFGQLTSEPGIEDGPCLSPDGQWLVYSGDGDGDRDIFLRSVEGQNPLLLTGDSPADDMNPAFSPDGNRIAFQSSRDGGGIFVMGRTGEGVRRVTEEGFNPAWAPDGTRLVYTLENVGITPLNMERPSDLWVVDLEGGDPAPLGVADGVDPSWSPNGHRIAYAARTQLSPQGETVARHDILTVPAGGGDPVPVTQDAATDWSPTWSSDGHIYFVSDRGGSMNLWRAPVDEESGRLTGELQPVTAPAQFAAQPCVSADGRHVVFANVMTTTQNAERVDLDPETEELGEATPLTTGTRRWSNPDPTGDGSLIALYSQDRPEGDLYVVAGDGTGLRQLTADSALDRVPRWSPDGSTIAYFSSRGGPLDVWSIRADGSDNRQVSLGGGGVAAWSPDGSRLALSSPNGSLIMDPAAPWDSQSIERLPRIDPSSSARFTVNDWSPDGRYLAGSVDFRDTGIVVYSIETGSYETLTDFGQWPVYLPDGRRILFVSGGRGFFIVDVEDGDVREIYRSTQHVLGPPRLTDDGRAMFFTRRVTEGDIWLLTLG